MENFTLITYYTSGSLSEQFI